MIVEEIGQRLKSARDSSGLTLAQINERTKIPFNHLEAIEHGNFDDLPEPVYVAGFIKRYADCVGLDGQQLADEYRQELDHLNAKPEKSGFKFKNRRNHNNQGSGSQPVHYSRQPIEQAPPNLMKMIPFYALWVVIILALIIYLFNRQESIDLAQQDPGILALKQATSKLRNNNEPNLASSAKNSQQSEPLPGDAANGTNSTEASNGTENNSASGQDESTTTATGNNQATLLAKKHVWVEVKAMSSGEALYTGFMETGTSHNFSDSEGLRIRAGNGGNVSITFAGKTADLGAIGKIAEKTFSIHAGETASASSHSPSKHTEATAHTEPTAAGNAKKTAEKPAPAKKPLVASGAHKSGSTSTGAGSVHKYEGAGAENKGIDVPYRYND